MKKSGVEWHKWFIVGHENVEDERSGRLRSHRTDEMLKKCGMWCIQMFNIIETYYVEILKQLREVVRRKA